MIGWVMPLSIEGYPNLQSRLLCDIGRRQDYHENRSEPRNLHPVSHQKTWQILGGRQSEHYSEGQSQLRGWPQRLKMLLRSYATRLQQRHSMAQSGSGARTIWVKVELLRENIIKYHMKLKMLIHDAIDSGLSGAPNHIAILDWWTAGYLEKGYSLETSLFHDHRVFRQSYPRLKT